MHSGPFRLNRLRNKPWCWFKSEKKHSFEAHVGPMNKFSPVMPQNVTFGFTGLHRSNAFSFKPFAFAVLKYMLRARNGNLCAIEMYLQPHELHFRATWSWQLYVKVHHRIFRFHVIRQMSEYLNMLQSISKVHLYSDLHSWLRFCLPFSDSIDLKLL